MLSENSKFRKGIQVIYLWTKQYYTYSVAVYGYKYILKSPEEPLPDSQLIILGEMV